MHKVPKVVPDHFRSGSLILDQSNKDLIRNQGTIFFFSQNSGGHWGQGSLIPDQFRPWCSLILDQSNKDLIRNKGTMLFSHKILEVIGTRFPHS